MNPKNEKQKSSIGNKEILSENLQKYMKQFGVTRRKMATDLDISYSTLRDWVRGISYPRIDKIELMANYFGVQKSNLIEKESADQPYFYGGDIQPIPVVKSVISGNSILSQQNIERYQPFPLSLLPDDYRNVFFMRADDKSMLPAVPEGALVLIHQQPMVDDKDIGVALIDHKMCLRRIDNGWNNVVLIPDNRDYDALVIDRYDNNNQVIGKAIKVIADV